MNHHELMEAAGNWRRQAEHARDQAKLLLGGDHFDAAAAQALLARKCNETAAMFEALAKAESVGEPLPGDGG